MGFRSRRSRNSYFLPGTETTQSRTPGSQRNLGTIHHQPLYGTWRKRESNRLLECHWGHSNRTVPDNVSTFDGGGSDQNFDPQTAGLRSGEHPPLRTTRFDGTHARQDRQTRKLDTERLKSRERIDLRHLSRYRGLLQYRNHGGARKLLTSISSLRESARREQRDARSKLSPRRLDPILWLRGDFPQDVHRITHRLSTDQKKNQKNSGYTRRWRKRRAIVKGNKHDGRPASSNNFDPQPEGLLSHTQKHSGVDRFGSPRNPPPGSH